MQAKRFIGKIVEFVLGAIVLVYLGLHTINFFVFTFPPEQQYLAWLGFGLTGGALIGYLLIFLWVADTNLKKTIALIMMVVSGIGEILAAGFGMTIEAWSRMGWQMTQQDFDTMLLAIRALAFAHAFALVAYIAGDKIGELLGDHDGDGTINALDPDYKPVTVVKPNKSSAFRLPWQKPAIVQNNADVGQLPQIRMDNLTPEQLMELAKRAQDLSAMNAAAQSGNGNGHIVDPQSRQR